jgi:peptidoglycan/xylan/chitin deacetylase (PgdA/CDA1 family)
MVLKKIRLCFLSLILLASALALSSVAQVGAGVPAPKREVAVTFDDLPTPQGDLEDMRRITNHLLESVKRNHVPAIGFVNEGKLYRRGEMDARTELLRAWLDAGVELGNHTYSHINLQRVPLAEYEDDVVRGETVTRMLLAERGLKLRYFRHPFLFTGTTPEYKRGLAEFLAARGYTVAPVTIDNGDYIFADVYFKARKRGDSVTAKRVADAYLPYMESIFDHFERLSFETFGREVKQVLLLHANELNADHFDELAAMLRRRGYAFVTLEEALKDPAYAEPDALYKNGISWLHRWRMAKGLPVKWEPEAPKFVDELYKAGQKVN